jgi:carbon-monoxide dehydrogenase large subunit
MLHARVVRSDHAHAYLLGVDSSAALALPGVKAVITGAACSRRMGSAITDQYPIARDKVRYWGEPVAVVVAISEDVAEKAAALVEVTYDPLPPVLHPRQSVEPGAPLLHPELESYPHDANLHPQPGSNVAHHYHLRRGNAVSAFAEAHLVLENEYWIPWIAHVQLEPHGAIARWDGETMSLWTSSQAPFFVRDTVAKLLELSPANVRVQIPFVGGGFGGKSDVTIEPLMAVVAHEVPGLPIQLVLTREEVFFGTAVGRGCWANVRTAVDADGKLLAQQTDLYFGAGGYADYSIWISQGGGHNATGPYYIPHLDLSSSCVYTNTPPTGAYRGYGHPEVHWMMERQMDQIARRLGMDPVELRRRNLLQPGLPNALGQVMKEYNGQAELCLQIAVEHLGHDTTPTQPNRVRAQGIACFMKSPVMRTNAQSGAILRFNEDGTVTLFTGAVEIGQGMSTIMTQIAAQSLSMPMEMVHASPGVDTEYSPHEWQTVASHTTWAVGNAVRMAAEDALAQIKKAGEEIFNVPQDDLVCEDGCVFPGGQVQRALTYAQIGVGFTRPDGKSVNPPIIGRATFVPTGLTFPDPATGQGNMAASWTFGCQGADVEVDLETGKVYVLRLVSVQDPGTVVNPETARGQVEGAMIMALGAALMEKLQFSPEGVLLNHSFVDYRIPATIDIPEMEVIFVETKDASGPYGARGLGEHGIVAVPPAIANALSNALGVDFYEIPISPERVMDAISQKEGR